MQVGDQVEILLNPWWARNNGVGAVFTGVIVSASPKAIEIRGHSFLRPPPTRNGVLPCRLCGKPLTDPASQSIGYGPDCAIHLGLGNKFIRSQSRALTREEIAAAERRLKKQLWIPRSQIKAHRRPGETVLEEAASKVVERRAETRLAAAAVAADMRHEEISDAPLPIPLPLGYELRPYQWRAVRFMLQVCELGKGVGPGVWDLMGLGKGSPFETGVLTPTGWQQIGLLKVGDQVIGANGRATTVTGVYHRGVLPVYRVTMSDGASVRVDGDHLWAVRTAAQKYAGQPYRTVDTRTLHAEPLKNKQGNARHYIPMVEPVEFEEAPFELDPYILGVLLGDGALTQDSVSFAKPDDEMGEEVRRLLPEGVKIERRDEGEKCPRWPITGTGMRSSRNPVLDTLRRLGVQGCAAHEKFIPDEYKFASSASRLALLQGLLDTDGSVGPKGNGVEFSSTSHRLALDVQFLVESLGGTTHLKERQTYYTHNGEKRAGRPSWRLSIALPGTISPFRLTRKAERYVVPTKYQPTRAITSIEPDGEAEVVCISVDAPDRLYVTEHFIVTHNTIEAILFMMAASARLAERGIHGPCVVICPPFMTGTWKRTIEEWWQGSRVQVLKGYSDTARPKVDVYILSWAILAQGWEPLKDSHGAIKYQTKKKKDGTTYQTPIPDTDKVIVSGSLLSVLHQGPVVAVGDEVHNAKNPQAQRSRAVEKLVMVTQYNAMMTGTAVLNRADELTTQLGLLNILDVEFGGKEQFEVEFCNKKLEWQPIGGGRRRKVWKTSPPKGEQLVELHRRLVPYIIRRRTEHVLPDMPLLTVSRVLVELANRQEYEALEEEIYALPPMQRMGKLGQLRQLCGIGKIPSAVEWVENFLECDEKLIVFGYHQSVQKAMLEAFEKWGPVALLGRAMGTTDKKRQEGMDRFQTDEGCLLAVCSSTAAREGITLTAAANILDIELEWTPGIQDQKWKRAHRIGQKDPVTVWVLAAPDSMDDTLFEKLASKRRIAGMVHDGAAEVLDEQLLKEAVVRDLVTRVARRKKKGKVA